MRFFFLDAFDDENQDFLLSMLHWLSFLLIAAALLFLLDIERNLLFVRRLGSLS